MQLQMHSIGFPVRHCLRCASQPFNALIRLCRLYALSFLVNYVSSATLPLSFSLPRMRSLIIGVSQRQDFSNVSLFRVSANNVAFANAIANCTPTNVSKKHNGIFFLEFCVHIAVSALLIRPLQCIMIFLWATSLHMHRHIWPFITNC
jgi:hypothetical protein